LLTTVIFAQLTNPTFQIRAVTLAPDAVDFVINALEVNSRLRTVRFRETALKGKAVRELFAMMRTNTAVEELDLYKNPISADDMPFVASTLPATRLRKLNLSRTNLEAGAVRELAVGLAHPNCSLEELDLSHNRPTIEGSVALAAALKENRRLTRLSLNACRIPTEGMSALTQAFQQNRGISFLTLSHNKLNNVTVAQMMTLANLQAVRLSHCGLSESEAKDLAASLAHQQQAQGSAMALHTLDVSNNAFRDGGVIALSNTLRTNQTLTALDLSENQFADNGAKAVAVMLTMNDALRDLKLRMNLAHRSGLSHIADALARNRALTSLAMDHSGLDTAAAVSRALQANRALTKLSFTCPTPDFKFGDDSAAALASALHPSLNKTLTKLSLVGCHLRDSGLRILLGALQLNRRLCSFEWKPPVQLPFPPAMPGPYDEAILQTLAKHKVRPMHSLTHWERVGRSARYCVLIMCSLLCCSVGVCLSHSPRRSA
jgi:Ran GTPase-activating protein (RanGAP) involved in mRNA processing and transport